MFNFLIRLLGGVTKARYNAQERALRHFHRRETRLQIHRWHQNLRAQQWAQSATRAYLGETARYQKELEKLHIVQTAKYYPAREGGHIHININPLVDWLLRGNKGARRLIEDALCNLVVSEFQRNFAYATVGV
jgi:hypothetical protein